MPIEVSCPSCSKRLRVKDDVGGKKIKCPKCKGVIAVPDPQSQTNDSPAPKADNAAGPLWHMKAEDGEVYGPVPKSELDGWVSEGLLTGDCQVLADGEDQWQWASDLYPHLDDAAAAAEPTPPSAAPTPGAGGQRAAQSPVAPIAPKTQAAPQAPIAGAPQATPTETTPQPQQPNQFGFVGDGPKPAADPTAFDFGEQRSATARMTGRRRVKRGKGGSRPAGGAGSAAPTRTKSKAASGTGEVGERSKLVAGLLGVLLGGFGVHRFYLGYTQMGIIQIVVTLFTCGVGAWWGIIEGIMIFAGSMNTDADGNLLKN